MGFCSKLLPCLLFIGLAACSDGNRPPDPKQPAAGDEHIACAVGGETVFRKVCAVDRVRRDGTLTLVVRHPDGAFRRFDVLDGGRGLAVADGAQQAIARYEGGLAELAVGGDRYRFPITLKQGPSQKSPQQ